MCARFLLSVGVTESPSHITEQGLALWDHLSNAGARITVDVVDGFGPLLVNVESGGSRLSALMIYGAGFGPPERTASGSVAVEQHCGLEACATSIFDGSTCAP
jgi:hypothetical protein